ncbi:hypothetical protein PVAG01_09761 [Phlyctema vagabunda]|uniref:DUF1015 domain-containing protein n=1 Tax=Phlyctema vagabunda TaxID=108571 RepID=A0ABR4P8A5_9HELO
MESIDSKPQMNDVQENSPLRQVAIAFDDKSQFKIPLHMQTRADIPSPSFEDLFKLAMLRIHDIIEPNLENPPPRLFPMAESTRATFFTREDWDEFGNLETEIARLLYTLTRFPDRAIPSACLPTLGPPNERLPVLGGWTEFVTILKLQVECSVRDALQTMQASSTRSPGKTFKSQFITVPTDYDTCKQAQEISISLWKRSLAEIASQLEKSSFKYAREFLEIHAFLKDPFGGLRRPFDGQLSAFISLIETFRADSQHRPIKHEDWQHIAAQAAQESSYLANSELEEVAYIHFYAHQQLPYIYTHLNQLSRAEFTEPEHVLNIIGEILNSKSDSEPCRIAPIAMAFYPSLEVDKKPLKVIIDGNHRATAFMALRFLATQPQYPEIKYVSHALWDFCQKQDLGIKWHVDLQDVLVHLDGAKGTSCRQLLKLKKELVAEFVQLERIPALVVQEENFHTICKQRVSGPKPVVLLPMHQALFNDESLGLAFPQRAAQAHGRPLGFKALPFK